MRRVFPDQGSQLIYSRASIAGIEGEPLLSAAHRTLTIYKDPTLTLLADLRTLGDDPIPGSIITIDSGSTLPLFYGPDDGTDTLYDQFGSAIAARVDDRIDELDDGITAAQTAAAAAVTAAGAATAAAATATATAAAATAAAAGVADDFGDHVAPGPDKHTAAGITVTPAGTIEAGTVQAALEEVAVDAAADLAAHVDQIDGAHPASAIAFEPPLGMIADTVQAAIAEVFAGAGTGEIHVPPASGGDDTALVQGVIDTSPEGSTLVFDHASHYHWTSVQVIGKSLRLDLNGAQYTVDPYGSDAAAIDIAGVADIALPVAGVIARNAYEVVMVNAGDASAFTVGDWAFLQDATPVAKWDGSGTIVYTGRAELVHVIGVVGVTVQLAKPTEYPYSTAPTLTKIAMLDEPAVIGNGARINEIDHGDDGPSENEDIVRITYAVNPKIGDFVVDGWNRVAANAARCINPRIRNVVARYPFRPLVGGHGYLSRFVRSIGGLSHHNTGIHVRHLVDHVASIDCGSAYNIGLHPSQVQFLTHGFEAYRAFSFEDVVHSSGDGSTTLPGWQIGNGSFYTDYGMTVIRPKSRGATEGARAAAAGPLYVIDPDFSVRTRGVSAFSDAHDVVVDGGTIEITDPAGSRFSVYSSGRLDDQAPAAAEHPIRNITVRNVKLRGEIANIVIEGTLGRVVLEHNEGEQTPSAGSMIVVQAGEVAAQVEDLVVVGNRSVGGHARALNVDVAPTRSLIIDDNKAYDVSSAVSAFQVTSAAGVVGRIRRNASIGGPGQAVSITGDVTGVDIGGNFPDPTDATFARPQFVGGKYIWFAADGRYRVADTYPAADDDGVPVNSLVPTRAVAGSFQVAASDIGSIVEVTSALPAVVTVPLAAVEPIPPRAMLVIARVGAGTVQVVGAPGVTIQSEGGLNMIAAQNTEVRLRQRGVNTWLLAGALA